MQQRLCFKNNWSRLNDMLPINNCFAEKLMIQFVKYFFTVSFLLVINLGKSTAQVTRYCRENALIVNADDMQVVPEVSGNYHLLSFSRNEHPKLFVYNRKLELVASQTLPFNYSDRSQYRIITFNNYYYISLYSTLNHKYQFFKIEASGNCINFTEAFQKILVSQVGNVKLGFQLIPYKEYLWMVYNTGIDNINKRTVVMVQADSMLNIIFSHKVQYDFKRDEEKLLQEILVFDRYMVVLKSLQSGSALELMKVNLATGYTIRNTFRSSGYIYSQAGFTYNDVDTSVTISSLLTEPGFSYNPKQYVFVSRLNKILIEKTPFTLLKTQFRKNTSTNFLLVDGSSRWVRFKKGRGNTAYSVLQNNPVTVYEDLINKTENNPDVSSINRVLAQLDADNNMIAYSDEVGVRFSQLNSGLQIITDSLVKNTKDWYTLKADSYTQFEMDEKKCLLVAQQFYNRKNGLLLVNTNTEGGLQYTYMKVNEKYNYLLPKAKIIARQGVLVPYVKGKEAGFITITAK